MLLLCLVNKKLFFSKHPVAMKADLCTVSEKFIPVALAQMKLPASEGRHAEASHRTKVYKGL